MRFKLILLAGVTICGLANPAGAHVFLEKAQPPVGEKASPQVREVVVRFSGAIEQAVSSLKVYDASGREVDKRDKHSAQNDPDSVAVSVPMLTPGKYRVVWRAVSKDSHITKGDFFFEVTANAAGR